MDDDFPFRVWIIDGNYPGSDKCVGTVETLKLGNDLFAAAERRYPGQKVELRNKAMTIKRSWNNGK